MQVRSSARFFGNLAVAISSMVLFFVSLWQYGIRNVDALSAALIAAGSAVAGIIFSAKAVEPDQPWPTRLLSPPSAVSFRRPSLLQRLHLAHHAE